METILSLIAIGISVITFIRCYNLHKDIEIIEDDLRDCAIRTRTNTLKFDTLDNKVNKPKAKKGRPSKKAPKPPKIIHQLNGK